MLFKKLLVAAALMLAFAMAAAAHAQGPAPAPVQAQPQTAPRVAYDPANGNALWRSHIGQISNAPQAYMLDGHQYILTAVGDTLYKFTLY